MTAGSTACGSARAGMPTASGTPSRMTASTGGETTPPPASRERQVVGCDDADVPGRHRPCGTRYLLYNGDGYGATGIGYARRASAYPRDVKVCLACQTRFDTESWTCPDCGAAPPSNGYLQFAPELAEGGAGFDPLSFGATGERRSGQLLVSIAQPADRAGPSPATFPTRATCWKSAVGRVTCSRGCEIAFPRFAWPGARSSSPVSRSQAAVSLRLRSIKWMHGASRSTRSST